MIFIKTFHLVEFLSWLPSLIPNRQNNRTLLLRPSHPTQVRVSLITPEMLSNRMQGRINTRLSLFHLCPARFAGLRGALAISWSRTSRKTRFQHVAPAWRARPTPEPVRSSLAFVWPLFSRRSSFSQPQRRQDKAAGPSNKTAAPPSTKEIYARLVPNFPV